MACIGERRGAYKVLVGKREGKRPLGRPSRRWETIKIVLQQMRLRCGLDQSCSEERLGNSFCENGNEHSGSMKCEDFLLAEEL
jgi:hypothetical protein